MRKTQPEDLPALARAAVEDGIARYFADRQARVRPFVDRHFSLAGSLALHRAALGADVLRAPANLVLAGPHAGLQAVGLLAGKLGAERLARAVKGRRLLLRTDVARQTEWLILTELLELPCRQRGRRSDRDALAETILSDPRVTEAAAALLAPVGARGNDPAFRDRLTEAMASYAGTRAAAAEITTSLLTLSTGALAVKHFTPGAVSLGPALAAILAQQAAIASFPFGAGLGSLWYSMFPAAPSLALVAGLTGGLMLAASGAAAFAGVVADPVQRRLGLHERRLRRMLRALERQMRDPAAPAFAVRDQYVARLLDLFDLLGSAWRLAHGA
ncbi:MAG TPA: DUF6635 family protein [Acetobacteraceae bacterium]|nr:DUF6635 family protein [Acetobacteraceae bacterium]